MLTRNSKHIFWLLPSVILSLILSTVSAQAATVDNDVLAADSHDAITSTSALDNSVASGVWGTCNWAIDENGMLLIYPGEGDGTPSWLEHKEEIVSASFIESANTKVVLPVDSSGLFYECGNLIDVDFSGADFSRVQSLSKCFAKTAVDYTVFKDVDTSHVTDMSFLFTQCTGLSSVDLSKIDMSEVVNLYRAFAGSSVTSVECSKSITIHANCESILWRCDQLKSVNLSLITIARNPESSNSDCVLYGLVEGCPILSSVKLPRVEQGFDGINLSYCFNRCYELSNIDLSGLSIAGKANLYMQSAFANCTSLVSIDLSPLSNASLRIASELFSYCSSLESVDFTPLDTSLTLSMYRVFYNCSSLKRVDFSNLDTTSIDYTISPKIQPGWGDLFTGCNVLEEVRLSGKINFNNVESSYLPSTEINGHTDWYSEQDAKWYTSKQIAEERWNVSDTYRKVATKKNIEECVINLSSSSYVYDGTQKTPAVTVKDGYTTLSENTHYTVNWPSGRTNSGTYTLTVTGKDSYAGTKSVSFTISPKPLSSCTMTLSPSSYTYDGKQKNPTITVKDGNKTLAGGTDYAVTTTPSGRTNAGTYTYVVTGKNNYTGTKSASFTIVAAKNLTWDDLHLSFGNHWNYYGYPNPYYISIDAFYMVWGKVQAEWMYKYHGGGEWGGNCFGMSATSCLMAIQDSRVRPGKFRESATKPSQLSVADRNSDTSRTLTQYIEALQVSQWADEFSRAEDTNYGNLDGLCTAVLDGKKYGKPVIVSIFGLGSNGKLSGHAILAYDVQTVSKTEKRVLVYDPNYSSVTRYVKLSTNSSGKCTGWYYYLNDIYHWGSAYAGSAITFTPCSVLEDVWANGGGKHTTNILISNSQRFEVTDAEGKLIAKVEAGELVSSADGVRQHIELGVLEDGSAPLSDNVTLYLPSDSVYVVTSFDSSINSFDVGLANVEQAASVVTDASEVTFAVNDSEEVNLVDVSAGNGESYSISLTSELESAVGQESIELSGMGNGGRTSIGTMSGRCVIVNGRTATMTINGEAVDIGGRISIEAGDVALEYTGCDYSGKVHEPKVTVTHNGAPLEEERDYVVKYSNNIDPGTATASIYGIGDYDGRVELTFTIAQAFQTITASDKTVAVGKTVGLGARTSGDGKLTYKSSDPSVATVDASGTVAGVKAGKATITVTAAETTNYKEATKAVTVTVTAPSASWKRLAGNGRYDTMAAIVNEGWSGKTGGTVVVATGEGFKDALAAAGLAGLDGAPVVLTASKSLSGQARTLLKSLRPKKVYVAGGTFAVSDDVLSAIESVTGVKPDRVFGANGCSTSAALATAGEGRWGDTAIIATDRSFKDALSVAPISYAKHWPILLAGGGKGLNKDVLAALKACKIKYAYIVGGTSAVTPAVEKALKDNGITLKGRLAGDNGVMTSRAIADFALENGLSVANMAYATSQDFPDALAGAALCGRNKSVLLLCDDRASGNLVFSTQNKAGIEQGYVFGGKLAFSDELMARLPE